MDSLGIKTTLYLLRKEVRKYFYFLHMTFDVSYCVVIKTLNIARIIINQHFPKKKTKIIIK